MTLQALSDEPISPLTILLKWLHNILGENKKNKKTCCRVENRTIQAIFTYSVYTLIETAYTHRY